MPHRLKCARPFIEVQQRCRLRLAAAIRYCCFWVALRRTGLLPIHSVVASDAIDESWTSGAMTRAAESAAFKRSAPSGGELGLRTKRAMPDTLSNGFGAARRIWLPSICQLVISSGAAMLLA